MITSKIAANQAFTQLNKIYKGDAIARQAHSSADVIKTPKGNAVDGIKADISSFSTNPLHQFNAEFNAVVKSIRIADQAMDDIAANVEQMESEVEMFLKQYPPYPPGSEDRIKYLSRFAMLRKQIDQLTIPPDAGARRILGEGGNGPSDGWNVEIGGRSIDQTILRQPMYAGFGGLDLPEIAMESSDDHVKAMHVALGEAKQKIQDRRAGLAQDAAQVIRSAENLMGS